MSISHLSSASRDLSQRLVSAIDEMSDDEKIKILKFLDNSVVSEKRHRYRKPQHIQALLGNPNQSHSGIIRNLSPGGAFLNTGHLLPAGSEVNLSFTILNFEFPVKLNAEVVWISADGMGIRFKHNLGLSHRLAEQKLADAMRNSEEQIRNPKQMGKSQNSKFEYRNPKQIQNPNVQMTKTKSQER